MKSIKYMKNWKLFLICFSFGIVLGVGIGLPIYFNQTNNSNQNEQEIIPKKPLPEDENKIKELKKVLKKYKSPAVIYFNEPNLKNEHIFNNFKKELEEKNNIINSSYTKFMTLKPGKQIIRTSDKNNLTAGTIMIVIVDNEEISITLNILWS